MSTAIRNLSNKLWHIEMGALFIVSSEQTLEAAGAITQLASRGEWTVTLHCNSDSLCQKAIEAIRTAFEAASPKGDAGKAQAAINRIRTTTDLEGAKQADIVIESVFEVESVKRDTIRRLDSLCSERTIIASNTSTIPITHLAAGTHHPDRIIGMHFIYFSPLLKVVEIVGGIHTSEGTVHTAGDLARGLGLESVAAEDVPGLLSTRIWMVHLNEAANNVLNKLVEPQALKKLNRTISPHAYSILESADFIGIDNCVAWLQNLYQAYGDPKYAPSPLLMQMLDAGHLGVKTGKGFFNYT